MRDFCDWDNFVRSGFVGQFSGSNRNFGINGYHWSLVAASVYYSGLAGLTGCYLNFYATGFCSSSEPNERWSGFPIRCLAYQVI